MHWFPSHDRGARKAEQDTLKAQQDRAREGRAERELSIKEQRLDLDRDKAELAKLSNQAQKETNALKQRELELKIEGREQKIAENERKVLDSARKSISATERGLETANRLLEHPGLEAAVGTSSILPTRPGSDAADFEAELAAFDAQIFSQAVETMKGLGALSEAEGRKISAAAGALSPTMSEKAFKRSLTTIRDGMQAARDWLLENAPEGAVQPETAQPTIDDLLSKYGN